MVPLLIALTGMNQRSAATTSLVAILPTAISGSVSYGFGGEVDLLSGAVIAVGGMTGSYIGSRLLQRIPLLWLRWMFVALLVIVAVRMLLVAPQRGGEVGFDTMVALGLIALGLFAGVASGLFGIGGGVIIVPALIALFGAGDLVAKGTSLLVMVPTALVGTITNARAGQVDLRAGVVVGVAAVVASFGGVALAFAVPPEVSGMLFAGLLLVSAAQLVVRLLRDR